MKIASPSFAAGDMVPSLHTCDGEDLSPPLKWDEPPEGTKSFALISDDPDAPGGTWVRWVIWNIPSTSRGLAQGMAKTADLADGTRQGTTDFREIGYGGPCPPSGTHRYYFRLFALDSMLDLPAGAIRTDLDRAMRGHVLAQAELMGKYRRT